MQVVTISLVNLLLDKWLYYDQGAYPTEDTSVYTLLDYIREFYSLGYQFAVRYY